MSAPTHRHRSSVRTGLFVGAGIAAIVLAAVLLPPPARSVTTVTAAGRPSILFILADDLDLAGAQQMPILWAQLGRQGVTFTNAFVSVSVCCPSRATILRGQYSHNTGIETNTGTNGGFATAYRGGIEASTIATWLRDAGYATAHFGKYLNGYPGPAPDEYVPPGWEEWYSAVAGDPYSEYDYTLNENGTFVTYGHAEEDYGTTVYTRHATSFITRAAAAGRPFFAFLSVYAPHLPATPAPPDVALFPDAQAPRLPSFNEADVSDKPAWLQAVPLLKPWGVVQADDRYRLRIRSLQSVDRAIGELLGTLKALGQLENTFVVFMSDNGFHLGLHRLPQGKQSAFEEDVRVPFVVRGPGVPRGRKRTHMVANIDLAPTFAAMAGIVPPAFVDGRSLLQVLSTTPPAVSTWRHTFLLEHWLPTGITAPDASPLEPPDADDIYAIGDTIPEYHAVRTARHKYVEYITGEKELYDLALDPYELTNIVTTAPAGLRNRLHTKLAALQVCAAESCRVADR